MELAEKGRGFVSPNPVVGAVLVRKAEVVAEDWHRNFGEGHAERNLLESLSSKILKGDVLYLNLEPCCHLGKTMPCTDIVLESGVRQVVVGLLDPNPEVSGKGLKRLRDAGVEVLVLEEVVDSQGSIGPRLPHFVRNDGLLKLVSDLRWQNRFFLKWIQTGLPWVSLKIAQTLDGRIVPERGQHMWLTGSESRRHVHQMRAQYDALLVGVATVIDDDSRLNVRDVDDQVVGPQPRVAVLDAALSIPLESKVVRDGTLIFRGTQFRRRVSRKVHLEERGVEVSAVDSDADGYLQLEQVLHELGSRGLSSVYVEGGPSVWSSFLQMGLVDELMIYTAPRFMGNGVSTFDRLDIPDSLHLHHRTTELLGHDIYSNVGISP